MLPGPHVFTAILFGLAPLLLSTTAFFSGVKSTSDGIASNTAIGNGIVIREAISCLDQSAALKSEPIHILGSPRFFPVNIDGGLKMRVEAELPGYGDEAPAAGGGKATIICDGMTLQIIKVGVRL
jgi:hypothetical protein